MPRTYTLNHGHVLTTSTEDEAYENGYTRGETWDARFPGPRGAYEPGGPWVCHDHQRAYEMDPQWKAYCDATQQNNEQWRRGWRDGHTGVERKPLPMEHVAILGYN